MTPLRIAVISPVPCEPPNAGNRARISEMVHALDAAGHEVHFLFADYEEGDLAAMRARFGERFHFVATGRAPALRGFWSKAWRWIARRIGVWAADSWPVDAWFDRRIADAARDLVRARKIDTVLCEYVFTSATAEAVRGLAHTALDCHDLFGARHEHFRRAGMRPAWFSTSIEEETAALRRLDSVIAIAQGEAAELRRRGLNRVFCVGPLAKALPAPLPDPGRPALLFVGSENPINVNAMQAFVATTWPLIRAARPDAELLIAGKCGAAAEWPAGVRALGGFADIVDAYRPGAVVINPVEFGTGFCIKTMEALGFGRPLVTTPSGARGLEGREVAALRLADSPASFARHCAELLGDAALRARLGAEALRFVEAWNREQLAALDRALRPGVPAAPAQAR